MRLGLAEGIARMSWFDRSVTALISRRYRVLLMEFDRGVGLTDPDPMMDCYGRQLPAAELPWQLSRCPLDANPRPEIELGQLAGSQAGVSLLTQRFNAGRGYTIGLAFEGFADRERATLTGRLIGREFAPWAQQVRMLLTIVSHHEHEAPQAECRRLLQEAIQAGPEAIRDEHRRWWANYWGRGLVSVGDSGVQRWYCRSLYLCGSMLEPGQQMPGLQGPWCGENNPPWFSDYHSNINIQSPIWGLYTNNRMDLIEPYLRLYSEFAEHARAVARDYFGMRGLKWPHAGSIGGHELTSPRYARIAVEPGESAWLAQLFWQFYRFSGDRDYLQRIAWPLIRDVADFIADYLVWDETAQRWSMGPMIHFEAQATDWQGWDENTLYGQAFLRLGLTQALEAQAELGADPERRATWRNRLNHLPDPPLDETGAWKAFENQPHTGGGHNFVLPMIFPADLVSAEHGPDVWRQQAKKTWDLRRAQGEAGKSGGAWCGGQGVCEILRLGDTERAFKEAAWPNGVNQAAPNGFNLSEHVERSFIQVDHGPGMCRVLADMALLELGGVVHLFYGIPADVPARCFSLRAPGGVLVSAEKRGRAVDYAVFEATREASLSVANPWPATCLRDALDGTILRDHVSDHVVSLNLAAGQTVTMTPASVAMDDLAVEPFAFPADSPPAP
jgi:hypothetical protein